MRGLLIGTVCALALLVVAIRATVFNGDAGATATIAPPARPAPGSWRTFPAIELANPGVTDPVLTDSQEVNLPDQSSVIGVVVGQRARAYVIEGMAKPNNHIVNDVIGGLSMTVTYCDRTGCSRVFSDDAADGPLDMAMGGWDGEEMLVLLNGERYAHTSADVPLSDYPYEQTTWREWKERHPDSEVYLGDFPG